MNYTETYNRIYSALSTIDITHEKRHNSSIRITDALNDIYSYINRQFPEAMGDIMSIVEEFSNSIKFKN